MYFKAVALINSKSITVLSLSGIITALVTPFDRDGAFDRDAWIRLLDMQLAGGVQGVVIAGSTGEAATLTDAEYDEMLCSAVVRGWWACAGVGGYWFVGDCENDFSNQTRGRQWCRLCFGGDPSVHTSQPRWSEGALFGCG